MSLNKHIYYQTMEYIDTFHSLNPHLFITPNHKRFSGETYTITRNPPTITRLRDKIIEKIKLLFGYSATLFEGPHTVTYPKHIVRTKTKDTAGSLNIINVYMKWGEGYYHFLTEVLPSVLEIDRPATIHCHASAFATPIFRWFDIMNPVVFAKPPTIRVKHIYEQPYIECGNPSLQKIEALRKIVLKKVSFTKTKGILIKRKESYRQILNHDAVFAFLKTVRPDLEWVCFDSLSFSDTVALFSQASLIIAPHGAGLTNMLFSGPGTSIVECMPVENPNLCYWHLSELLGHRYTMIPCPTQGASNFIIDVEVLTEWLERSKV